MLAAPAVVLADGRVAFVAGNSAYDHIGRLPNPENDANDMSAALRRLGFEVTTELNADLSELTAALRAFTRRSTGADVALVFYAGHGMEMDGVNYLLPVDARVVRDTDVRYETLTLEDVLAATTGASLRMVILDACRDNPLARSMQRTVARRSISRGSFGDLDESLLGDETLVAYAAAAGTTADDGTGRNSPYTAALLEHLEQPLEVLTLFRRVRAQVLAATNRRQRPHEYQSLLREHYLSGVLTASTSVTVDAVAPDVADVAALDVARLGSLAEQGHAGGQAELGVRYATGRGVQRDDAEAVRWYRRHITANWRGTPLTTYETIVDRIGNVRTATGLRVRAELDAGEYPTGVTVTKEQLDALALVRDEFTGNGITNCYSDEVGSFISITVRTDKPAGSRGRRGSRRGNDNDGAP